MTHLLSLQSDEMEDQTVSDDDFQNVFTHRNTAHGAEREPVQQSNAKVCVTTDDSAECCDQSLNYNVYSLSLYTCVDAYRAMVSETCICMLLLF